MTQVTICASTKCFAEWTRLSFELIQACNNILHFRSGKRTLDIHRLSFSWSGQNLQLGWSSVGRLSDTVRLIYICMLHDQTIFSRIAESFQIFFGDHICSVCMLLSIPFKIPSIIFLAAVIVCSRTFDCSTFARLQRPYRQLESVTYSQYDYNDISFTTSFVTRTFFHPPPLDSIWNNSAWYHILFVNRQVRNSSVNVDFGIEFKIQQSLFVGLCAPLSSDLNR